MKQPKPLKLSREIRAQMRRNAESLMRETLALLRPDRPRRIAPKPAKRVGATPRR